ncbi:MAG: peptidoglycan DD-metalloendopeptidase family protein [Polyangiaceae bacterium]
MNPARWLLALTLLAMATLLASDAFAQKYRFPIELPASGTQPYVTAYRDHDTGAGLKDWNCGSTTYNGHKGSDFGIGSFPVMDAGSRWVVAAAPGTVVFTNDGCFDRCTTADCGCGSGFGNYVKVQHSDGKSTYYAHMMTGSLQVSQGQSVTCGQRLGKVGSSGNSSGPHLHFEMRYASNTSDDPFQGGCGGPTSEWVNQGPYKGLPGDQCEKPPEVDDAEVVTIDPSTVTVTPGAAFQVTVTMKNIGNTTWTMSAYALASTGTEQLGLSTPLAVSAATSPQQSASFVLDLTAPLDPGSHAGAFRMRRDATGFGQTANLALEVAAGGGGAGGGWGVGGELNLAGASSASGGKGGGQKTQTLDAGSESGCGCRLTRATSPSNVNSANPPWQWALALALLLRPRRRPGTIRHS